MSSHNGTDLNGGVHRFEVKALCISQRRLGQGCSATYRTGSWSSHKGSSNSHMGRMCLVSRDPQLHTATHSDIRTHTPTHSNTHIHPQQHTHTHTHKYLARGSTSAAARVRISSPRVPEAMSACMAGRRAAPRAKSRYTLHSAALMNAQRGKLTPNCLFCVHRHRHTVDEKRKGPKV